MYVGQQLPNATAELIPFAEHVQALLPFAVRTDVLAASATLLAGHPLESWELKFWARRLAAHRDQLAAGQPVAEWLGLTAPGWAPVEIIHTRVGYSTRGREGWIATLRCSTESRVRCSSSSGTRSASTTCWPNSWACRGCRASSASPGARRSWWGCASWRTCGCGTRWAARYPRAGCSSASATRRHSASETSSCLRRAWGRVRSGSPRLRRQCVQGILDVLVYKGLVGAVGDPVTTGAGDGALRVHLMTEEAADAGDAAAIFDVQFTRAVFADVEVGAVEPRRAGAGDGWRCRRSLRRRRARWCPTPERCRH